MKTKILIGLILLLPVIGFSQGEWNNWYFGVHAAMTFVNGEPVALPSSSMSISATEMSISVSDSKGHLLFYSNGKRIWSWNHTFMTNGTGLLGGYNSDRQPVFAAPVPGNLYQYYLFTIGSPIVIPPVGLHYSIIDMSLNGGYGNIIPDMKNIPLPMGDSAVGQLTGIWIIL